MIMDRETREYIKCGKLICLDDSKEVEESKDKENLKRFIKESIEEVLSKNTLSESYIIKTNNGEGSYVWKFDKRDGTLLCGNDSDKALRFKTKRAAESWLDVVREDGFEDPIVIEVTNESLMESGDIASYFETLDGEGPFDDISDVQLYLQKHYPNHELKVMRSNSGCVIYGERSKLEELINNIYNSDQLEFIEDGIID